MAADRSFFNPKTANREVKILTGLVHEISAVTSGDKSTQVTDGVGFTFVRVGGSTKTADPGKYEIRLDEVYNTLLGVDIQYVPVQTDRTTASTSCPTAMTCTVTGFNVSAAAGADRKISFTTYEDDGSSGVPTAANLTKVLTSAMSAGLLVTIYLADGDVS